MSRAVEKEVKWLAEERKKIVRDGPGMTGAKLRRRRERERLREQTRRLPASARGQV